MSQPNFTAFLKHCQTLLSAGAVMSLEAVIPPKVLEALARRHQVTAWTGVGALYGHPRILFDRTDPDEVERAHACYEALFAAGQAMGCVPYRLGVQSMALLNEQHAVPELLQRLKQAVDPQNIIAPGRYGLG